MIATALTDSNSATASTGAIIMTALSLLCVISKSVEKNDVISIPKVEDLAVVSEVLLFAFSGCCDVNSPCEQ